MQVSVEDGLRVPMPDGVTLSARVWRPDCGPVPAILEMLPYRKRDGTVARDATTHAEFARHGYVCLRVDLRGCGESDGLFEDEYSARELQDIHDTIAWIAAQPWCDGSVGIMGISWGGFNGLQVAALQPPALKAVISICSSVDRFADDIHYKGGCLLGENIGWAACAMSWFASPPDPDLVPDWRQVWQERLAATPFLAADWTRHNTRDAYWRHGSVCEDYGAIKAAVLSIGGWHDGYRNTIAHLVENLEAPVKGIVGPWNHKYPHLAAPAPQMDFVGEALRWWDHWLNGMDTGVDDDLAYRAYLMDSVAPQVSFDTRPGQWVALDSWPAGRALDLPFGTDGMGVACAFQRRIATNTFCGRAAGEYFPFGFGPGELPDDQQIDDDLSLCFDSAAFETEQIIIGAASVDLTLAADQPAAQVMVRLSDIRLDGSVGLIAHGMLNLRQREGHDRMVDLEPGIAYDVTVPLDQIAYRLPVGHRLRVAISPSYWPFIWPEAAPVELTVTAGRLQLPVQDVAPPYHGFVPPRPAPAPVLNTVLPPRERKLTWDEDGSLHLIIHGDHGETEDFDHGLITGSRLTEHWQIARDAIATARVDISWERWMRRGDWEVRTLCETRMTGDADAFEISARLEALDGQTKVFARDFHERVSR
ncbi:CocE/NonD family hydrolase [Actibacterium sp. 188UL27-1]|uniref:CocE/NonD family hydrolase n=1 Tax=Actibacterium sp. 188UL27-1 TaxID=2786961 RepID=UPI00195DEB26|nr:CocE/NonD family hydrolase [Actibacterium sp. 188UL27-1]MBM7069064.1 CocE/NonD family hydrolase [Actibacterium sp. 188UL27-1]